jgi:ComF family protein
MIPNQPWLLRLGNACLDFFFPPVCAGCQRLGEPLCAACAQQVEPVPATLCARCGHVQARSVAMCAACAAHRHENKVRLRRAAALHTTPLREAIHALKYEQRPELAAPLARYLVAAYAGEPWRTLPQPIDAVVPVPLHAARLAERGYNQSLLLAAAFCARTGLPLQAGWLERVRSTRQQVGLGPQERYQNVAGAFAAAAQVAGQTLLLVDDVCTTGATMEACAAAAMVAGANAVYGLALAMPKSGEP